MKPENSVTADISSSLRSVKRPQLALHFPRKEGGGLVAVTPCTLPKRKVVRFFPLWRVVTESVSVTDSLTCCCAALLWSAVLGGK